MHLIKDGHSVHLYTSDPASGGTYVGTVPSVPGETPDSDELLARLGVQATPFEYDFADDAGLLGVFEISRDIPKGARILGGFYKVDTTFTSA